MKAHAVLRIFITSIVAASRHVASLDNLLLMILPHRDMSDKRGVLPPHRTVTSSHALLRTVRVTFITYGSSLSKAFGETQLITFRPLFEDTCSIIPLASLTSASPSSWRCLSFYLPSLGCTKGLVSQLSLSSNVDLLLPCLYSGFHKQSESKILLRSQNLHNTNR